MRRSERETRDEARDELLGEIREDVRAIRATMTGNGAPGCREECRANTTAIRGLRRVGWLLVAAVITSAVSVAAVAVAGRLP